MDYSLNTTFAFFIRFFEVTAEFTIMSALLNKKLQLTKVLIFAFICTIIVQFTKPIIPYSIYWILPTLLLCFLGTVLFKSNLKRTIVITLIILTCLALLDCLFSLLLLLIFKLPTFSDITKNESIYYLGSLFIVVSLFIISYIICVIKSKNTLTHDDIHHSSIIIFNIIIAFILIIPSCFIILLYFDNKPLPIWIIFVNILSLLLITVINIINSNKRIKEAINEERTIYQQNYITTLENLVDGLRTFKHDYSNTLATINGYIQLEKWDSLKKFFEQTLDESKAISTLDKLNPNLIKNPTIFGLITAKYQKCLKNNVKMNFEILGSLENLSINEFDFTRILGILLDNAIEAASSTKSKKINLLISENKQKTTLELSNTYPKKSLSTEKIFEKGISSKGKDRGLGLYKVKQILNKYPNILLETNVSEKLFLQKLVIPKEFDKDN